MADEDKLLVFDGAIWRDLQAISTLQNMALLGVNTTADTNNRLSVSSPGVLLTHAGTDQRLKINKQAAADTASLLYQTNFSGRAELGLAGDDDFHFKVSANGSVWNEAIVIDKDTGAVTMPNTAPGGLADGDKGDITVSGGATVWTIDADAVGDAKIRNSIANSVIGRAANTTGDPADIAATADGQVLRLSGTTLGFGTVGTAGLGAAVVGNGKLATMVNGTIKARVTAGTGTPDDATGTQITALLDPFTSALKGLAPASGGGTANFLRADGTWAAPASSAGVSLGLVIAIPLTMP